MTSRNRPSTILVLLASIIFSLGLLAAFIAYRTAEGLRYDASIINNAGIIRGSIQRAAKQTLSDTPEQSTSRVIDTIDNLLESFLSDRKGYGEKGAEQEGALVRSMREIAKEWNTLKVTFAEYRLCRSEELRKQVLVQSERCWELADAGVLTAQHASEHKLAGLRLFYAILLLGLLNTAVVVWFVYAHVRGRLEYHAAYDVVTSLPNRRSYETEIERECARSKRYDRRMSLIIFDIDFFKTVNDRYGHKAGDEALRIVANLATRHVRETDTVYRLGGDEFAVVVPETELAQACEVAEKIRKAVEQHHFPAVGHTTISVGVSELQRHMTVHDLCLLADEALYQAKQDGRNTCRALATGGRSEGARVDGMTG